MKPFLKSRPKPTCGALFAGIGGFCLGFDEAGFDTVWALDQDSDAELTYSHNIQETEFVVRDVTKVSALNDLPPVDVLHAGFPCQSFSQGGDRMGFDDPRGQLFFEIIRLLNEWGSEKPRVLVLENAPYLLVGDGGRWFDQIRLAIQRAGYWFSRSNCAILDTFEHTDLPQRRARLFMVATNREWFSDNEIGFEEASLHKPPLESFLQKEPVEDDWYFLDEESRYFKMIKKHADRNGEHVLFHLRKYVVRPQPPNVCPTLTANMGGGGHNVPFLFKDGRLRKLTEQECLNIQGFPKTFNFPIELSHYTRYRLVGNSVSPKISRIVAKAVRSLIEEID